jgi:hypothetical protein
MTGTKILIPMIRKTMPTLFAQDMVGVQPMGRRTGSIFKVKSDYADIKRVAQYINKKYWPYQHVITVRSSITEVERWCYANFKGRYWRSLYGVYGFKREADYSMFLLRWS